nr:flagellar motor switch protein FliN [Methylomarinum sp. Ch1-1]MDP4519363.1 flagellar motor switch protein FliN [Methylomarinum sp. Ch1-1]
MDEQSGAEADWGDAMKEQAQGGSGESFDSAEFPEFDEDGQNNDSALDVNGDELKLDVILDVPVTISMEIGRTKINIRNLLQLNQGSVVELDRLAGEPMDVLVNGTLIAHGEVVVVNDKFGIRLTDVISPSERVKKLG